MFGFKRNSDNSDFKIAYRAIPFVYKVLFVVFIGVIVFMLFWYTEHLRKEVIETNRRIITVHAKLTSLGISEDMTGPAQSIIFEEIIEKADYPLIETNTDKIPTDWRNVGIARSDTTRKSLEKLKRMVEDMGEVVRPVEITIGRSDQVVGYVFIGEPDYIRWVRIIPIFELIIVSIFAFLGITIYNRVRNFEKQNIWLGMAREMAHQLGTPISSLLGWTEILRDRLSDRNTRQSPEEEYFYEVVEEMDKDIQVLSNIVVRFGQIGSKPALKPTKVPVVVSSVVDYLRERIPRLREKISLKLVIDPVPMVNANELLLSWACENLIKNAVDALGKSTGKIKVSVRQNLERTHVMIVVTDNGKGISLSDQRKIFSPGFSTKKRGWGLGLSLAKRIAEEYHHGRLYLLESHQNDKTTFVIELPIDKKYIQS